MTSYPYISGQGALVHAFEQLRKSVPPKVDADYLRRFNIAPANESYVISILRFLGLIDEDGNRVDSKSDYLYADEEGFKSGLEGVLRAAYSQLFDDMNDAFQVERDNLVHWFRAVDKTSQLVGRRQASTFRTLAALAGHGELPVRPSGTKKPAPKKLTIASNGLAKKSVPSRDAAPPAPSDASTENSLDSARSRQEVGLSVRIEVNLPPGGDAETYDAIFASIKKHLMS